MKTINIKLSKTELFGIETQFLRNYNSVRLTCCYVQIVISRPITTVLNKGIDWWLQTRLHKIRIYYKALKAQIDADLYFVSNCDAPIEHNKKEQQISWNIEMDIKQFEPSVPTWLKSYLNKRIEKYYEKQYQKQLN